MFTENIYRKHNGPSKSTIKQIQPNRSVGAQIKIYVVVIVHQKILNSVRASAVEVLVSDILTVGFYDRI